MEARKILMCTALLIALTLSACGAPKPEPTPTLSTGQIQTAAVSTFAADLTQTAFYQPTATFTPSPQPTNTLIATIAIGTRPTTGTTSAGTTSCNNLVYVSDVTIPDNTVVTPGQSFTKTWRVQNSGTCAWGAGYKFSLIGGDAMSAQAVTLTQTVAPGATYEISVPMTAPSTGSGTISATWRMADAAGTFFGDALTVVVSLGSGGGSQATATTGAPAATATSTP